MLLHTPVSYMIQGSEGQLGRRDERTEVWFKPVRQCFRTDFIQNVAKANRTKLDHSLGVLNFRDQHNIGVIQKLGQVFFIEKI